MMPSLRTKALSDLSMPASCPFHRRTVVRSQLHGGTFATVLKSTTPPYLREKKIENSGRAGRKKSAAACRRGRADAEIKG
jgi:hypothetical protein